MSLHSDSITDNDSSATSLHSDNITDNDSSVISLHSDNKQIMIAVLSRYIVTT